MSYVLHVWEQPVPTSVEGADGIVERLLLEGVGTPSSKLDELAKVLWAHYPRDLESDPGDPVWADTFSKGGREPLKVETLAIATPYLDELVPFVANTATNLGLLVYDPQYGTVYLPGGGVLGLAPPSREASPAKAAMGGPAPPARLLRLEDASLSFVAAMGPFMATHGFDWKKLPTGNAWVRVFPGGQQRLAPVFDSKGPSAGLAMVMRAKLFAVDPLIHQFAQPRKPTPTDVLFASLKDYLDAAVDPRAESLFKRVGTTWRISINSAARLEEAVAAFQQIIPQMLSDMQAFETLSGTWQNALEEAAGRRHACFTESIEAKLVAGALLGGANLDEVAEGHLRRYDAELAKRRQGASAVKLEMLAAEEGRVKDALASFLAFVGALVVAKF